MSQKEKLNEKRTKLLDTFGKYIKAEQKLTEHDGFIDKQDIDNHVAALNNWRDAQKEYDLAFQEWHFSLIEK